MFVVDSKVMFASMRHALIPVIAAAALLAGCGHHTKPSAGHNRPAPLKYTKQQVVQRLHLYSTETTPEVRQYQETNAMGLHITPDCEAQFLLMTPGEIGLYADAGNAVPTNPSDTIGVIVDDEHPECFDVFQTALKALP